MAAPILILSALCALAGVVHIVLFALSSGAMAVTLLIVAIAFLAAAVVGVRVAVKA